MGAPCGESVLNNNEKTATAVSSERHDAPSHAAGQAWCELYDLSSREDHELGACGDPCFGIDSRLAIVTIRRRGEA